MTVTEVKTLLRIPQADTTKDQYLADMVPHMIEFASEHCGQTFDTDALPGNVKVFVAKACEYFMHQAGVTSETIGGYSVATAAEMPSGIMALLNPFVVRNRRVKFI